MLKTRVWASVFALLTLFLSATAVTQEAARQNRPDDESGSAETRPLAPALVGVWKATPEQTALTTDFDKSVWGANASSVREVALTIGRTGEATLTVTRKVVDARGRARPASTSVEEAQLLVSGAQETTGPRVEHGVKVVSAERRYPDDPQDTWMLEGLRVRVVSFNDQKDAIEVRFDTPEGRGSFWETLHRDGRRSSPR